MWCENVGSTSAGQCRDWEGGEKRKNYQRWENIIHIIIVIIMPLAVLAAAATRTPARASSCTYMRTCI